MVTGAVVLAASFPRTYPRPLLFLIMLAAACLTAAWKVNLPIPLTSGSTLSVSYAAKMMALLLLGPHHAVMVAVAGAFTQCTYKAKRTYPLYRTVFSMTAEAITMAGTGAAYLWLGGPTGSFDTAVFAIVKPVGGAIGVYFLLNTGLVAGAIAMSTGQPLRKVWSTDFLWSSVTFMVAGTAGAVAAIVINRGHVWIAMSLIGPVYLTYRTYQLFVARLDDQQRHMAEMQQIHEARNELLQLEQAARANAEQANKLKDQFLAIVSHELRTPLNAILGWTDMLRKGIVDDARRERAYQVVFDSAQRQAQLVEDLLDIARIVSGKLRLELTPVDLEEVVRSALTVAQPAIETKKIRVDIDSDGSIGVIAIDRARFQQIVWNLLSNAVKFTPPEGRVHVRLRRSGEYVELSVADNGQGFPADFMPALFEPFRQADESTTRANAGLGLGLSIVKRLVEAHGGTVSAYSEGKDRGATFTVRLATPSVQSRPADGSGADLITLRARPAPTLKGISVLVVDDDDEGRLIVAMLLEAHQARVFSASSAEQAIDVLQRESADVLLADIAMPEEDGYTLIRKVRALTTPAASIPAAALTAFARDDDRVNALRAGFQSHIAKPVDVNLLVTTVARLATFRT
jgi:signal transduction histidine kinase